MRSGMLNNGTGTTNYIGHNSVTENGKNPLKLHSLSKKIGKPDKASVVKAQQAGTQKGSQQQSDSCNTHRSKLRSSNNNSTNNNVAKRRQGNVGDTRNENGNSKEAGSKDNGASDGKAMGKLFPGLKPLDDGKK